jgi:hypothetical protein
MFQQTYFIQNLNEKNPVEIRYIAGVRATLTHLSAAAEGRFEIVLVRDAEGAGSGVGEAPACGSLQTLFQACVADELKAFHRADFPGGQFPRLINGDALRIRLTGKAKSVCLALTFAEG